MNRTLIMVSALACALIPLTVGAMEAVPNPNAQQEQAQAPQEQRAPHEIVNSYINLKAFLCQLGALLADEAPELERKKFLRLALFVRFKELPALLSLDSETVAQFFNLDNLKIYIDLCTKEDITPPTAKAKAKALKKCLNIPHWQQALGCPELERVIDLIVNLYYFEGTAVEKMAQLQQLKQLVTQIRANADEQQLRTLTTYFDLDLITTVIDEMLAGQVVPSARIAKIIKGNELVKLLPEKARTVEQHAAIEHLLKFVALLMLADKPENGPSFLNLIECLRWDNLVETLAANFGFEPEVAFNMPRLKELLRAFQQGTPVTKAALIESLNLGALGKLELTIEVLDGILNFEEIANALNAWRRGEEASLAPVIDRIEGKVGVDIRGAMDSNAPEWYQQYKLMALKEHITNSEWFLRGRYHLLPVAALVTLWSAGHAICHPCMELFEPQRFVTAGLLALASGYVLFKGAKFFSKETTARSMITNSVVSMVGTSVLRYLPQAEHNFVKVQDLLNYTPENHLVAQFLKLITDAHLVSLPSPRAALNLLNDPLDFLKNPHHEKFILDLCTIEPLKAQQRFEVLAQILANATVEQPLPHYAAYDEFMTAVDCVSELDPSLKASLAHPGLLLIARYHPRLLLTQTAFMKTIHGKSVLGQNLMLLLLNIVE